MIGLLPHSLNVCGVDYPVNSDFRVALRIFTALSDESFTELEKAYITVNLMFTSKIPSEHFIEAVKVAYWFLDGGDIRKTEPSRIKTFDWEGDQSILFPAINKVVGYEVRECSYLHWWTFLGVFGEIGDGLFSQVMQIRNKRAQGKKLEKWEKEYVSKNKELFRVAQSKEDAEAIRETEQFLSTLI